MSSPDDKGPGPGSNAIGTFAIGQSPVGTIPPFDWWRTVVSQYANSQQITDLVETIFKSLDQTQNLDDFFDQVWNVLTAEDYGLDVWARIVAIGRVLSIGTAPRYFGFEEGLPDYDPFNTSPFYSGQKITENYIVAKDGFRVMILAKAFSNICDGSIPSINKILKMLFGQGGKCYVVDNGDMTMTYKFEFRLTPLQQAILQQSGVMPKPTGVKVLIEQL